MERDGSIQRKERVCWVHESLLLVRLDRENGQPHVEWEHKCDRSQESRLRRLPRLEKSLEGEKRPAGQRQHKPHVEIEEQISNIESPRLRAKDVRPFACTPENIVRNNVPGHHYQFTIKGAVDRNLKKLNRKSKKSEPW